ncbi:hypothetical protein AXF42_Ash001641 [Apostasia shenzhenica]|uniref:Uncharacterized protein n=1 Tax=Apostasia shenzhenica TaxID=1088818 RepID=A0A2I0AAT9_9ASPA|nr:hypothetical protein AXF42_Ash001641 [Apostasia shenzhenica]
MGGGSLFHRRDGAEFGRVHLNLHTGSGGTSTAPLSSSCATSPELLTSVTDPSEVVTKPSHGPMIITSAFHQRVKVGNFRSNRSNLQVINGIDNLLCEFITVVHDLLNYMNHNESNIKMLSGCGFILANDAGPTPWPLHISIKSHTIKNPKAMALNGLGNWGLGLLVGLGHGPKPPVLHQGLIVAYKSLYLQFLPLQLVMAEFDQRRIIDPLRVLCMIPSSTKKALMGLSWPPAANPDHTISKYD